MSQPPRRTFSGFPPSWACGGYPWKRHGKWVPMSLCYALSHLGFNLLFSVVFCLTAFMVAVTLSCAQSKVKQFVCPVSPQRTCHSLQFTWLSCDISSLMVKKKLWFCRLFSFLSHCLEWEWHFSVTFYILSRSRSILNFISEIHSCRC